MHFASFLKWDAETIAEAARGKIAIVPIEFCFAPAGQNIIAMRWYNICVRSRDGDGAMRRWRPHRKTKGTEMRAKKATCDGNAGSRAGGAMGKNATIIITNGCFAGLEIKLEKDETTLGSEIACDICLDHTHVSAEHAVIRRQKNEFVLEDRGSRRGTKLNGNTVHRAILHGGDTISIGVFELKFSC